MPHLLQLTLPYSCKVKSRQVKEQKAGKMDLEEMQQFFPHIEHKSFLNEHKKMCRLVLKTVQ